MSNISDAHFRTSRKEFSRISELFSSDISTHRLTVKALEATAEICLGNAEFQCKFAYGDLINKMKIYVGIYFLYRLCNRMGKAGRRFLTFISACIYKAQKLQVFSAPYKACVFFHQHDTALRKSAQEQVWLFEKKVGELLNKRSEMRLRSISASGIRLSMTGCAFQYGS